MCAFDGGLATPEFGRGVDRERLTNKIAICGARPVVVVGPSGCGKSFLAAQHANRSSRCVAWLSLGGEALAPQTIAEFVARFAGLDPVVRGIDATSLLSAQDAAALVATGARRAAGDGGMCLVLDDWAVRQDIHGSQFLSALGNTLFRVGAQLIVTTQSVDEWPARRLTDWCLIDGHDLALTLDEAVALCREFGLRLSEQVMSEILGVTAGHAALFLAMALHASKFGVESTRNRSVTLDAWLDRATGGMTQSELQLLRTAACLQRGSTDDLIGLGFNGAEDCLRRIGVELPLVKVHKPVPGLTSAEFCVHGLVDAYLHEHGDESATPPIDSLIAILSQRSEFGRASELLSRFPNETRTRDWLAVHGREAFVSGHIMALSGLLESLSASALMAEPGILVLWSRVCHERGLFEESMAKAKAARTLALHQKDSQNIHAAIGQLLLASRHLGKLEQQDEARGLAEEIIVSDAEYVDDRLRGEAMFCIGCAQIGEADFAGAESAFRSVVELSKGREDTAGASRLAQNSLALLPALTRGDFQESRRLLSRIAERPADLPTTRVMIRGNLAQCLVECGRTEAAELLVKGVLRDTEELGLDVYAGAYLPILGAVRIASGDDAGGVRDIQRGVAASQKANDRVQAAMDRVGLSMSLRAIGRIEESLTEAERALDVLSERNAMGLRRAAEFEVAASLLACGDVTTARKKAEAARENGADDNPFHGIRCALIEAECYRIEDALDLATNCLAGYGDYLSSGNANLLLAMYCRAFPSLLGLLALSAEVRSIPSHLLKMIPAEDSERALIASRVIVDDAAWRNLGTRLLGHEEFDRFLARDGLPVCHVHFFGGLTVSVGGRAVRDKDWGKRKARLLFAMLILRRGQDVPRDQVFEYLFPDMDPERAKNNLYVVWSTMKSVLMGEDAKGADLPYFEAIGGVCRAVSENIRSDVDDFDRLCRHAREHEAEGDFPAAIAHYERLATLYRGDLLPGDVYDDWFTELRERYRITFVNAMLTASQILMDADDPGNALIYARRAIETDPLREDLYQVALRCQIAAGQRSGAIDTFLQCRTRLAEDLGLDPSAETRALYEQILVMEDRPRIVPLDPFGD